MRFLFAHAGEVHDTVTQVTARSLLSKWYIALTLFVILVVIVGTAAYFVSRKSIAFTLNTVLATFFIAGVATYTVSAPVSILSLGLGFALALLQVLTSLAAPHSVKSDK